MKAIPIMGSAIFFRLMPQLCMAIISLERENVPRVSRVDIRTANGMIWLMMDGIL